MRDCCRRLSSLSLRRIGLMVVSAALLGSTVGVVAAEPPYPRYGVRLVDGDTGDWNFASDFYAQMYRAGKPDKPVESWLYLRYDCTTNTLYILVRGKPKVPILVDPAKSAWVAINEISNKVVNGNSGNDGVPPDFAWVGVAPPPGDTVAAGFEASVTLMPGTYKLIVHADVYDDDETQTSAVTGFPKDGLDLILDCTVPVEGSSWGRIKTLYR